jgi:hypothetical protein
MKCIEVLCWGIEHIAQNHNFGSDVNYEENGEVCIYGGCNVPTLSDVGFLCEDLGIDRSFIDSSQYGIDVWLPMDWYDGKGQKEYKPTGMEMWKRYGSTIGN